MATDTSSNYNPKQLYAIRRRYRELEWEKTEWGQQRKAAIKKSKKSYAARLRTIENKRQWNIERKRAITQARKNEIRHRAQYAITCGVAEAEAAIFPLTLKYSHGQILSQAGAKVAMAIVELSKTTGDIWASAKTIAKYAGVTERTAQAWRHKFEELKILTVEMWGGIDIRTGAKLTNHDRVNYRRLVGWIRGKIDEVEILGGRLHYSVSLMRHVVRGCIKTGENNKYTEPLTWDFSEEPFPKLIKTKRKTDFELTRDDVAKKTALKMWEIEPFVSKSEYVKLSQLAEQVIGSSKLYEAYKIFESYIDKVKALKKEICFPVLVN